MLYKHKEIYLTRFGAPKRIKPDAPIGPPPPHVLCHLQCSQRMDITAKPHTAEWYGCEWPVEPLHCLVAKASKTAATLW